MKSYALNCIKPALHILPVQTLRTSRFLLTITPVLRHTHRFINFAPMPLRLFKIVSAIALVVALLAAAIGFAAFFQAGFYPAFPFLCLLLVVPMWSRHHVLHAQRATPGPRIALLTLANVLTILLALWLGFVVLHDRVLQDCC